MRKTLFISHATPADNDFVIWLTARLQLLGYDVWIDKNALNIFINFNDIVEIEVPQNEIDKFLRYTDSHQRVHNLVNLYSDRLVRYVREEEVPILAVMGLETPNPLSIEITRGEANIEQVCRDILALTKLNYNACIYGDGLPATLRFADSIGEVLTAGPEPETEVLPFKHYV